MLKVLKITVHTDIDAAIAKKLAVASTKAEHVVAVQAAKDTSPFVPALTGSLDIKTQANPSGKGEVNGGYIIYPGPYARYLYYGKLMVDPYTGSSYAPKGGTKVLTDKNLVFQKSMHPQPQAHWFEASKAQNLDKWLRVAERAVKHEF